MNETRDQPQPSSEERGTASLELATNHTGSRADIHSPKRIEMYTRILAVENVLVKSMLLAFLCCALS